MGVSLRCRSGSLIASGCLIGSDRKRAYKYASDAGKILLPFEIYEISSKIFDTHSLTYDSSEKNES
jgi:hypothetical protein